MKALLAAVVLVGLAACASPTAFDRGLAHLRSGRDAYARADFDEALFASAAALANRGVARASLGDLDGAIEDYTRALELAPEEADILFNRGNAWLAKGEFQRAMADFVRAIEADPGHAQALFRHAAVELGREPRAAAAPRPRADLEGAAPPLPPVAPAAAAPPLAAPAPSPLDAQTLGSRALTRELQGDHAGALEDLRAAIAGETDPQRLLGLRGLLFLLESSRDRRDSGVRGDSPR
jgi:tetratricopeptide (TPR) repeat protein